MVERKGSFSDRGFLLGGDPLPSYDDRIHRLEAARDYIEGHSHISDVTVRRGGAMEYDPRKGEVMVPDCVEFTISSKEHDVLQKISKACDLFGMRVVVPEFKQPDFTHEDQHGHEEEGEDVDYIALIRLVP